MSLFLVSGFVEKSGSTISEFHRLAETAIQDESTPFERRFFIEVSEYKEMNS